MKIAYILSAAGWAFLAWLGFSWLDVVAHNATDQGYAAWNLFTIVL